MNPVEQNLNLTPPQTPTRSQTQIDAQQRIKDRKRNSMLLRQNFVVENVKAKGLSTDLVPVYENFGNFMKLAKDNSLSKNEKDLLINSINNLTSSQLQDLFRFLIIDITDEDDGYAEDYGDDGETLYKIYKYRLLCALYLLFFLNVDLKKSATIKEISCNVIKDGTWKTLKENFLKNLKEFGSNKGGMDMNEMNNIFKLIDGSRATCKYGNFGKFIPRMGGVKRNIRSRKYSNKRRKHVSKKRKSQRKISRRRRI